MEFFGILSKICNICKNDLSNISRRNRKKRKDTFSEKYKIKLQFTLSINRSKSKSIWRLALLNVIE